MIRKSIIALGAVLALGLAAAMPAKAEDSLLQKLKAVSSQVVVMDDQVNVGVQWADTNGQWGAINQTLDQTNAGIVASVDTELEMANCNCFNDVEVNIDVSATQNLSMDDQINGALQVGLTDANITQDLAQLNVGVASSIGSKITVPTP